MAETVQPTKPDDKWQMGIRSLQKTSQREREREESNAVRGEGCSNKTEKTVKTVKARLQGGVAFSIKGVV